MIRLWKLLTVLACLLLPVPTLGQDENVMNYYAVDNSLDGQPIVDRQNVLKFFPVFAMRDNIQSVKVSLDYGQNRSSKTRTADKEEHGRYWTALMPKFHLGDAIQRIDVEVLLNLPGDYAEEFERLKLRRQAREESLEFAKQVGNRIEASQDYLVAASDFVEDSLIARIDTATAFMARFRDSVRTEHLQILQRTVS